MPFSNSLEKEKIIAYQRNEKFGMVGFIDADDSWLTTGQIILEII